METSLKHLNESFCGDRTLGGGGRGESKALRNCQSLLKANADFTKGFSTVVSHPGIQGNKIVLKTERKGNPF